MNCPYCGVHIDEHEASDWINVEKRMPEVGQKILVWDDLWALGPSDEFVGWAFIYMGEDFTDPLVLGSTTVSVSHWMPLPEPPSELKTKESVK